MTGGTPESVVVPATFSPTGYACLRSLGERGINTIAVSPHDTVPTFASRYCDEAVIVPDPREDMLAYRDALLSLVARPDVRTMIPTLPEDTFLLSKYRAEFEDHIDFSVPPLATLRTVHDRIRLFEAAKAAGVPVPDTKVLTDVDDWDRAQIVKSRYNILTGEYLDSHSEREVETVKSVEYLEPGTEPDGAATLAEMKHTPIVQEFVPKADEYLVGALYDRGEPVATFQHRQVRGENYAGGGGSYRESVAIPELEEVARSLLDHLDWHGLACIEYMQDANTGEFVLTEINPRMWRSLAFAVRAGADFPYYYWLQNTDRVDEIEPGYEVGVGGHFLHGEFSYLRSVLREDYPNVERPSVVDAAREILSSCYAQPNFDYLRLDDLGPFAQGLLNLVPGLQGRKLRRAVEMVDAGRDPRTLEPASAARGETSDR